MPGVVRMTRPDGVTGTARKRGGGFEGHLHGRLCRHHKVICMEREYYQGTTGGEAATIRRKVLIGNQLANTENALSIV